MHLELVEDEEVEFLKSTWEGMFVMSLIIQTPPTLKRTERSRLRSEILRMTLAAGALLLSFLLVAPVVQLKPRVQPAYSSTKKQIPQNPPATYQVSVPNFTANPPIRFETRPNLVKRTYTLNKSFSVEIHHRIE